MTKSVVASVFRRPQREADPEEHEKIFLRAGVGIDGDCHAKPTSPRQVLLVSTGAYAQFGVAPCSLRENILIDVDELRLSSGDLLLVGHDAALRVSFKCEPCARLNRFRPKLSQDIKGRRGYLARVVRSGVVRPGDKVNVVSNVFRSFPDHWRERVINIVRMLPADNVVSYTRLAELAGVPKSYCRSFPRLLRSHEDVPWQRVMPSHQIIGAHGCCSVSVIHPSGSRKLSNPACAQAWLGSEVFNDEFQFMSEGESFSRRNS